HTPAPHVHSGQPNSGQPNSGQPNSGQPNSGQPNSGQPNSGQPNSGQPQGLPLRKTIGDIVGAYKSIVANECLEIFKSNNETMGKIWQRNYWEHIIRDEKSFQEIATYVENNPAKWQEDKFFVGN
ncbi:MAG: transposase, partial [Anaerolineales bacterium]